MRRRHALAVAAMAFVACGMACVDLFHSTDFDTLCDVSPSDPRCGTDAAGGPDVVSEPAADAPKRPHPDFCSWNTLAKVESEAKRACALLGACEGPLGESVFGQCVVRAELAFSCDANPTLRPAGPTDDFWSCLATATKCAEVDRCVFPTGIDVCGTVDGGNFTSCGNGNVSNQLKCAIPQGGRAVAVEPCAMRGKTCSTVAVINGISAASSCTGTVSGFSAGAVACVASGCEGTVAKNCKASAGVTIDDGFDCASQSAKCTIVASVPACESTNAPACTPDSPPACVGAKVTACVKGHELVVDCSVLGLDCDVAKLADADLYDLTAACTLAAPECTNEEACQGATLRSCGRGKMYEVDCVSVGLGTCDRIAANGKVACRPL